MSFFQCANKRNEAPLWKIRSLWCKFSCFEQNRLIGRHCFILKSCFMGKLTLCENESIVKIIEFTRILCFKQFCSIVLRTKTINSSYNNEIITYLPPYTMTVSFRDERHAEEASMRDQSAVEQVWNISRCTIACLFTLICLKCGADFHYTAHIPYIPAWECWITECSGTGMGRAESLEREQGRGRRE